MLELHEDIMVAPTAVRRVAYLLALAGALTVAACSRNTAGDPGDSAPDPALIIFTNESLLQADVFAVVRGAQTRRLGTVFSGQTDSLTLSGDIVMRGNLSLVARLLGGELVGSGTLGLRPGDTVRVVLPLERRLLSVLPN
jgi:hypothetical protein